MIAKILTHFNIGILNLQYNSLGMAQEFTHPTLTNVGYFWNEKCNFYYFCVKGFHKHIYNFNDPAEFLETAEELVLDEQLIGGTHQDGANMHDADHGKDEMWLNASTCQKYEEAREWSQGQWQQNSWKQQVDTYRSDYVYGSAYQDYGSSSGYQWYGTGVNSHNKS